MNPPPRLYLASRSPRRRLMLDEAGIRFDTVSTGIDDSELRSGRVSPCCWTAALAYLKARGAETVLISDRAEPGLILAADTICVHGGRILGQPRDEDDARMMLRAMRNDEHVTITGMCLLRFDPARRPVDAAGAVTIADAARVRIGELSDAAIDSYVSSNEWRGKAGAYNLSERIAAGWPITCDGDPSTVMGLPLGRLLPLLRRSLRAAML